MITHASTTFPSRRSFSVHVEMISRGLYARSTRSSRTSSPTRMGPRLRGPGSKGFARPSLPRRPEADESHDRAESEEEEPEEFDDGPEAGGRGGAPHGAVRPPAQRGGERPNGPAPHAGHQARPPRCEAPPRLT